MADVTCCTARAGVLLVCLVLSIGCQSGPSEGAIQTAIAATQQAAPTATSTPTATVLPTSTPVPATPTPTPIPLAEIDLEPLLIQPGDLPSGYSGAQVRAELPGFLRNGPEPVNFVNQRLGAQGQSAGGFVTVLFYDSLADAQAAVKLAAEDLPDMESAEDVGEEGFLGSTEILNLRTASFAFVRCHAVATGQLIGTSDTGAAKSYALRLDGRLQPLACRE